jgi:hypothetical protein
MKHATVVQLRRITLAALFVLLFLLPSIAHAADIPATEPGGPPAVPHGTAGQRLQSLIGLIAFTVLAWVIGRALGARTHIRPRTLIWGLILQFAFGAIVVWNRAFLVLINALVDALLGFTAEGAKLVFGDLANQSGAAVVDANNHIIGYAHSVGYFAFFVLPTIIFFACLTAGRLSQRDHAVRRAGAGVDHGQEHGLQRRRDAVVGGEHFRRSD